MDCCAHEGPEGGDARFDIKKVADDIHVAVAAPAYKVNCNTAIIENDDGVIVVDTHSKPSAARVIVERLREMHAEARALRGEHALPLGPLARQRGDPAAYPHAEIVTNQITREAMVSKGLKRIQDHVRQVPAEIAGLRVARDAAREPAERARLTESLTLAEAYLAEVGLPSGRRCPAWRFEQTMSFYRRDREIHLVHLGRAHTEGDVFRVPAEGESGDHGRRRHRLDALHGRRLPRGLGGHAGPARRALYFTHIIMGHGEVAGRDWLETFRGYVGDMVEAVRAEVHAGAMVDEVKSRVTARLAPRYEKPFSTYGEYRPWRAGLAANIERAYAMMSSTRRYEARYQ